MAKTAKTVAPAAPHELQPERRECARCGKLMWDDYASRRTPRHPGWRRPPRPHRPPLPPRGLPHVPQAVMPGGRGPPRPAHHEFGLDDIALVGRPRYGQHRSVPEIRSALVTRGVAVCAHTVSDLLDRYDELLATTFTEYAA